MYICSQTCINMSNYSIETVYRIWQDQTGHRIEIGPDRDGLNLIEVRFYTSDSKIEASVIFTPEEAGLIHGILGKIIGIEKGN